MPSPDTVLAGLTAIANDWRWLAITWHVLLAVLIVPLLAGWRPSGRLLGPILSIPLLSVSLVAWLSGNPFNGALFAILAAALVATAVGSAATTVRLASPAWVVSGVAIVVFGWTYPHFIRADSWTTYLYASPFGILPCPTLTVVIGVTVIFRSLGSTSWGTVLVAAGLLYGSVGAFQLGVVLDSGLIFASGILGATAALETGGRHVHRHIDFSHRSGTRHSGLREGARRL